MTSRSPTGHRNPAGLQVHAARGSSRPVRSQASLLRSGRTIGGLRRCAGPAISRPLLRRSGPHSRRVAPSGIEGYSPDAPTAGSRWRSSAVLAEGRSRRESSDDLTSAVLCRPAWALQRVGPLGGRWDRIRCTRPSWLLATSTPLGLRPEFADKSRTGRSTSAGLLVSAEVGRPLLVLGALALSLGRSLSAPSSPGRRVRRGPG